MNKTYSQDIAQIHSTYTQRIHHLETWRHLVVAFTYAVFLPLVGFATIGKEFTTDDVRIWIMFFMFLLIPTTYATFFSVWSQRRVAALAKILYLFENDDKFLNGFLHRRDLYFQYYDSRPSRYFWQTNTGLWFQVTMLIIVDVKIIMVANDNITRYAIPLVSVLIIFLILFIIRRSVKKDAREFEETRRKLSKR